eukprot:1158730-Pelagomonas_calceolata.AAC.10
MINKRTTCSRVQSVMDALRRVLSCGPKCYWYAIGVMVQNATVCCWCHEACAVLWSKMLWYAIGFMVQNATGGPDLHARMRASRPGREGIGCSVSASAGACGEACRQHCFALFICKPSMYASFTLQARFKRLNVASSSARPKRLNVVSSSVMDLLKADVREQLKIIATGLKVWAQGVVHKEPERNKVLSTRSPKETRCCPQGARKKQGEVHKEPERNKVKSTRSPKETRRKVYACCWGARNKGWTRVSTTRATAKSPKPSPLYTLRDVHPVAFCGCQALSAVTAVMVFRPQLGCKSNLFG